jgi:hypothetical protein
MRDTEETAAYKEALRVMLGFRTVHEVEDAFRRPLVWRAVRRLEQALNATRGRRQPDEYALALAIEQEILSQLKDGGDDLEALFNDPNHNELPPERIEKLVAALWEGE